MKELSLAVVGADYPNKKGPPRRFAIQLLAPGDPVQLVPEPKNPADPNAIAVFSAQGVQVGYITAERAPLISKMMGEAEPTAIFQRQTRCGAIIRVSFNGMMPNLPPEIEQVSSNERDDSGFWPDEEWPDS